MISTIILEAREIREENRRRYEANRAQEQVLIDEERKYWNGYLSKATTKDARDKALDELSRLDVLERAS
jgi:hypothetical protein